MMAFLSAAAIVGVLIGGAMALNSEPEPCPEFLSGQVGSVCEVRNDDER